MSQLARTMCLILDSCWAQNPIVASPSNVTALSQALRVPNDLENLPMKGRRAGAMQPHDEEPAGTIAPHFQFCCPESGIYLNNAL